MTRRATDNTKALDGLHRRQVRDRRDAGAPQGAQRRPLQDPPDEINWGHVGTVSHYRAKLREITDSAFNEGEHAE
ncbi:hypothetical protein VSX64_16635 [Aurantimonas sp. C2-6-R+9]|uniref:hypothetical protein n=1 Tax=unclassified Aurantimonas TaxID=2638230 RepID=UPI002E19B67C|nr:hypothetical protein [Aurantimonas sp. C2-6-R+9]